MTDRQRAFLTAYTTDPERNATRAAKSAGYAWPERQGSRLCSVPELAAVIRAENVKASAIDRRDTMLWWAEHIDKVSPAKARRRWERTPEWYKLGLPRPKGARWPESHEARWLRWPKVHVE